MTYSEAITYWTGVYKNKRLTSAEIKVTSRITHREYLVELMAEEVKVLAHKVILKKHVTQQGEGI